MPNPDGRPAWVRHGDQAQEAGFSSFGNQEAARRELGLSRGEWRYRWKRYDRDVFRSRR